MSNSYDHCFLNELEHWAINWESGFASQDTLYQDLLELKNKYRDYNLEHVLKDKGWWTPSMIACFN